jgi:gamma-glutamylcyclotransferase (GGCT)/AIG2-like uncharacterized protein YtfP
MSSSEREAGWCHYFAFGSNMSQSRMHARIPEAESLGRAQLREWVLRLNKHGADGSAKANIEREAGANVWGVVYRLRRNHIPKLDRFEGGYQRIDVEVVPPDAIAIACICYASDTLLQRARCFDWYKEHMLRGAREHDLPASYIAMLAAVPDCPSGSAGV